MNALNASKRRSHGTELKTGDGADKITCVVASEAKRFKTPLG